METVPNLNRATNKLVTAGPFHAVDAQIGTPNADCVFRRPCPGWIVFRRHQSMPRINRNGDRSAQVDIAQTQNQIAGSKDNSFYPFKALETVHATDELEIAWAPWCVRSYGLHIFLNRH